MDKRKRDRLASAGWRVGSAEEFLNGSDQAETGGLPLTAAQTAELDRRLEDLERDPHSGEPWDAVRSRIEKRLDRGE
jgi:putative addiction module component (TIGR02574 family)